MMEQEAAEERIELESGDNSSPVHLRYRDRLHFPSLCRHRIRFPLRFPALPQRCLPFLSPFHCWTPSSRSAAQLPQQAEQQALAASVLASAGRWA